MIESVKTMNWIFLEIINIERLAIENLLAKMQLLLDWLVETLPSTNSNLWMMQGCGRSTMSSYMAVMKK